MQSNSNVPWKPLCCKGVNLKVQDSCDSFCLPYLFTLVSPLLHGRNFLPQPMQCDTFSLLLSKCF